MVSVATEPHTTFTEKVGNFCVAAHGEVVLAGKQDAPSKTLKEANPAKAGLIAIVSSARGASNGTKMQTVRATAHENGVVITAENFATLTGRVPTASSAFGSTMSVRTDEMPLPSSRSISPRPVIFLADLTMRCAIGLGVANFVLSAIVPIRDVNRGAALSVVQQGVDGDFSWREKVLGGVV